MPILPSLLLVDEEERLFWFLGQHGGQTLCIPNKWSAEGHITASSNKNEVYVLNKPHQEQ